MNVTITSEDDDTIEFDLEDTSVEFANALRRTMTGDIPTLAVENIQVTANNSGLFDEILAHRLGMVPWQFDLENYRLHDDCDCEDGCPKCQVSMALQKEGPATVTAADVSAPSADVEPAKPEMKIVDLQDDGRLDVDMTARLGLGKEHAKWQAANAAYSYEDDTFHFTVESVSGLAPRTIVARAVERLEDGVDEFQNAVEENL